MVSPHITGAAAEAAVAALCDENPDVKEVFDIEDEFLISDSSAATTAVYVHISLDFCYYFEVATL